MRTISNILENLIAVNESTKNLTVDYICTQEQGVFEKIAPTKASDLVCPVCGNDHFGVARYDEDEEPLVWVCLTKGCPSLKVTTQYISKKKRLEIQNQTQNITRWVQICDRFKLGDLNHGIKFELVKQNSGKINFMKSFAEKPTGLVYMSGTPGTGKTYLCMATLELYSRKKLDAMFITHRDLFDEWLQEQRNPTYNFKHRLENYELLIIDDFGVVEPSPSFMAFVMGLIDTRLKFSNRGIVINTNLKDEHLCKICGDALVSRLFLGQAMEFSGQDRRKKKAL